MDTITRVWIDEGCIFCHACVGTAPDVFILPAGESAMVVGGMRVDGTSSRNAEERSFLNAEGLEYQDLIHEAAVGCPIEIIHFDHVTPAAEGP